MMKFLPFLFALCSANILFATQSQWATSIVKSQSGLGDKQYAPSQVLGEPNVFPNAGFYPTAWMPIHPNRKKNNLQVAFEKSQKVSQIAIVETLNPGSLEKITLIDEEGKPHVVAEFEAKPVTETSRIQRVYIEETPYLVKSIEFIFNGKKVPGYNAIDAIGISDSHIPVSVEIKMDPTVDYDIRADKLGPEINSMQSDIKPVITADGATMYFSRSFHPGNIGGVDDPEDIWYSSYDFEAKRWTEAKNVGTNLNNLGPNYVCAISKDKEGNPLLMLGNAYSKNGKRMKEGSSFVSSKDGDHKWGEPKNLFIEKYYNSSETEHYSVGIHNRVMMMAVERPEGYGGTDLYVSFYDEKTGDWQKPINMGESINTAGDEISPFMADDDDSTLYFATNGRRGYGMQDIYRVKRLDDSWTKWSAPTNLGNGINSIHNDLFFSVSANNQYAYYCQNDETEMNLDVYSFYLPDLIVGPIVRLAGSVISPSNDTLKNATFKIKNLQSNKIIKVQADASGKFETKIPYGSKYNYFIEDSVLIIKDSILDLSDVHAYNKIQKDIKLSYTEKQEVMLASADSLKLVKETTSSSSLASDKEKVELAVKMIFFEFEKDKFTSESVSVLENIVAFLKQHKFKNITLNGYTDSSGEVSYNLQLSKKRADSVKRYFVKNGIDATQILTVGHGEDKPAFDNKTKDGRKKNRRVEIEIEN